MAIKKSSLDSFLSPAERIQIYYLEKSIDKKIIKLYRPGSRVKVSLIEKLSDNVERLIIERYEEAGWTIEFHFHELAVGNYVELF